MSFASTEHRHRFFSFLLSKYYIFIVQYSFDGEMFGQSSTTFSRVLFVTLKYSSCTDLVKVKFKLTDKIIRALFLSLSIVGIMTRFYLLYCLTAVHPCAWIMWWNRKLGGSQYVFDIKYPENSIKYHPMNNEKNLPELLRPNCDVIRIWMLVELWNVRKPTEHLVSIRRYTLRQISAQISFCLTFCRRPTN